MKNRYKIITVGIIFFAISINSMELSQPLMSGLCDVVRDKIQPLLSLQEIARFKQSRKLWNVLGDVERFCPLSHELECSTYACACLAKNYYACSKALGHFAGKEKEYGQKNPINMCEREKAENMFKHLYVYHAQVRDDNVAEICKHPKIKLCNQMKVYSKYYRNKKNIRLHILEYAAKAICVDDTMSSVAQRAKRVKTVLSGNSFDIFDLLKPKEDSIKFYYDEYFLFLKACQLNDVNVIKLLCGGTVNNRSLEYVMENAQIILLIKLIRDEILPIDVADGNNKSVLHYLAESGYASAIELVLDKGAYVNGKDTQGMTALHYAVKNRNLAATRKILSYKDADVRFTDKKGKKPIDYIPVLNWNPTLKPEELTVLKAIKKALKDHAKPHKVEPHSHAKVCKNGYQKLQ